MIIQVAVNIWWTKIMDITSKSSGFTLWSPLFFFFRNTKNIQFWTIKQRALANYSDTIIFRKYYEKYLVNKGKTVVLEKLRLISRNSLLAEYAWPRDVPTFFWRVTFSRGYKKAGSRRYIHTQNGVHHMLAFRLSFSEQRRRLKSIVSTTFLVLVVC